jgi:hypothetical protein
LILNRFTLAEGICFNLNEYKSSTVLNVIASTMVKSEKWTFRFGLGDRVARFREGCLARIMFRRDVTSDSMK